MPRLPLLLVLLLCSLVVSVGAAPVPASDDAPRAVVANDEDGWGEEEPGDEWTEDECTDDAEDCFEDDDLCDVEWEDVSDDELLASDDGWGDDEEWEEWADEECLEEEEEIAPPRLTELSATPARRNAVKVSFRLDRKSDVTLAVQRIGGARASGRARGATRGTVSLDGRRGANAATLRRWQGRKLQPGRYRLTATPADGRAATATFTLRIAGRR
jgi:hypothetical protein